MADTLSGRHVLIADDSLTALEAIREALVAAGARVSAVTDGASAVRSSLVLRPDAAVLDVTMDVLNGYHACRLLRQEPATREMPILLLTAREGTSARFWGMRAGADACLLKEDGLERLAPAIAHAIAARSKHTPGAPQPAGAGVSDGDLLSRVAALLDRELFRATLLNEVSALARHMDDLPATLEHLGIVLRRVVGVDVSFAALVYDAPPGVYALFRAVDAPESIWQLVWSATDRPGWQIPGWDQRALMTPRVSEPVSLAGLEARRIEAAPHWEFIYFQAAGTRPSDDSLELCALFARAATLVVSNARLHAEVQRFALTDDLTGVYNRRYVQGRLEVELERSARSGDSVGLILLDLDEFKSVNDRFGHLVGDAALRDTAQALSRILRPYDLMGRFGGEEFIILVPGSRDDGAPRLAERARQTIAALHVPGQEATLSASFGVTVARNGQPDVDTLLRQADEALYRAKQLGRNRVEVYGA